MATSRRSFILRHTSLQSVPGIPGLSLHLTDDVLALWRALQVETKDPETALPYWALAWGGGLALAHFLRDHPEVVAGRRVFELAAGSGLCSIVATQAGAGDVVANDIDPFATTSIALNAKANRSRVDVSLRDVLDEAPPDADVVLAGDSWYTAELAARVLPWLRRARAAGIDVLVGDPGRSHLPTDALDEVAAYDVRTTSDLEDLRFTTARVFRLRPEPGGRPAG